MKNNSKINFYFEKNGEDLQKIIDELLLNLYYKAKDDLKD